MTPPPLRLRLHLPIAALGLLLPFLLPASARAQQAEHVVLVVWSGLRPDMVTESLTPNLWRLAQEGTVFSNHHAVYPTTPLVNGVALLTGGYPGRNGVFADKVYFPALDPLRPVGSAAPAAVRLGDALSGGHYLTCSTLPELFRENDLATAAVGAGLLPLLADRALLPPPPSESDGSDGPTSPASPTSTLVYAATGSASSGALPFQAFACPAPLGAALAKFLKPYPASASAPNLPQDRWMTRALIEGAWAKKVPRFSLLWLSDPAYSQRDAAPGTNTALASIQGQDENLRLLLAALERKGVRGKTDVFVVSDTGYSTVGEGIDVADELSKAGFNAVRKLKAPAPAKEGEEAPKPALARGQVLVVGQGGTVLLYVGGHDREVASRLASFLQRSRFAGVIFSREARDGAFTLHQANLATSDWESLPDLLFAFRWTAEANRNGVPGTISADIGGGAEPRKGAAGSLSRFDLHATLIASGPDLRSGWIDDLPTGNADLAPTIAGLIGLQSPPWMDGRVLIEAIRGYPAPAADLRAETLEAEAGAWKQTLRITRLGGAVYVEEGNGSGGNKGGVGAP